MAEDQAANQSGFTKTIHSGKWYFFGIVGQRALSLISFLILARLLLPKDYGVLAAILLASDFLDQMLQFGFGTALLQTQESIDERLDILWTFDVVRSIVIMCIIAAFSGVIGNFFNISEYELLIALSGILIVVTALSNSRQLYFFKNLDFKKVFLRDITSQVAFTVISVLCAYYIDATVWALFFGTLAKYCVSVLMTYILSPYHPRINFAFSKLRGLVAYSKWIYGQNILNYFFTSFDKVVIGRMLDSDQLGLYARAKDLPTIVSSPISGIINKVGFSAFAKVQDKFEKVQEGFIKSFDMLMLVSVPFAVIMILEGGLLVSIFLGPKWLPIVIPLKIMSIGNIFNAISGLTKPLFNAIGKPKVNLKASLIQIVFTVPLIYWGIHYRQLIGAVVASIVVWLIVLLYTIYLARPILLIGKHHFFPSIVTVGIASLVVFAVDILARTIIHDIDSMIINLSWIAILGLIYLGMVWYSSKLFETGPWHTMKTIVHVLTNK